MAYVDMLKTFVRVYELGSMSAAARDLRVSAAVSSSRISDLEKSLGVRLFNRTTRSLRATAHGELFYKGAIKILDTIREVEGGIAEITAQPKGTLFISAPLALGKKLVAPLIPAFKLEYPDISVRLRLSDRKVDIAQEGLDAAFVLGPLPDSDMRVRSIHAFERVLVASPGYVKQHGMPENGDAIIADGHKCLLLRYPGATEFYWNLYVEGEIRGFHPEGSLESDDGDVLTAWALAGCGIINKTRYDVATQLDAGTLVEVATATPPTPQPFSCLYPHKRLQDPKVKLFVDHVIRGTRAEIERVAASTSSGKI
ncbi:MAG: LysR family transcriptional regulator [Hoeflea sp.]|uniref:LysR family transcriptional regulator n=1 Tax=Hoeflea sp. TaxID=1940281 RepID=UPI00273085EF|nr:LysR family transcriptional regulator [Hoeflea sp.]MDP2122620.1 LysR family transcriptional regulator [Hoeflea sp.]MDP3526090.1 LysR family transcriptional regulator [Hoeflea sp.]